MLDTPVKKFLVIDAIDECRKNERSDSLLPFLQELSREMRQHKRDFRIFATSRPEPDIKQLFDTLDGNGVALVTQHLQLGEQPEHRVTVAALIDAELGGPRFSGLGWSNEDFCYVKQMLLLKSNSMILWVHLQLQELDQCTGHEAREMVLTLPLSLDQTYERIMSRIAPRRRRAVRTVLECIIGASETLSLEAVAEIFLLQLSDLNTCPPYLPLGSTRNGHSANMETPDIFKLLPGLLTTREGFRRRKGEKAPQEVHFIHFTVQEYLLSKQTESYLPEHAQEILTPHTKFGASSDKACVTLSIVLLTALDQRNIAALPHLARHAQSSWLWIAERALPWYPSIAPALAHFLDPGSCSFLSWEQWRFRKDDQLPNLPESPSSTLGRLIQCAVGMGSTDEVERILALVNHPNYKAHIQRSSLIYYQITKLGPHNEWE
ncbi:hypothetical protein DL93DRAFT_571292 [Clavulina sp. PMI_390]|nr:hypothetical protein DL93DRAFT_571292 [Clavulina sp. PMI_390]